MNFFDVGSYALNVNRFVVQPKLRTSMEGGIKRVVC